jgi:hypothetical protein
MSISASALQASSFEMRGGHASRNASQDYGGESYDHRIFKDSRDSKSQLASAGGRRSASSNIGAATFAEHRHSGGSYWSTSRFEHLSRQGAFILECDDESVGMWNLKIRMQELEPSLSDEDMPVYCRWLHHRLHNVRQDLGLRSLKQLRTEVNFAKNGLTDAAVARLLQALQRSELQVVCLNLYGNRLGPVGARHVTDFLWESSSAVREVHLSHNEIDDEAAVDMIRLLADHPKYQPRRNGSSTGEMQHPVWIRLDHNYIEQPRKLLRTFEKELGITFCLARNRHTCGPAKCGCRSSSGFPLVHLYTFELQDNPASPSSEMHAEKRSPQRLDSAPQRKKAWQRPIHGGGDFSDEDRVVAEMAAAQVQFPGRSSVVARVLANKLLSKDAAAAASPTRRYSPRETSAREVEDPADETVSYPKDEEVHLECQVVRDDRGSGSLAQAEAEDGEVPNSVELKFNGMHLTEEKPEVADKAKPPQLSLGPAVSSSGTPLQGQQEARRLPQRSSPPPLTSSSLVVRGVPEVTPEPDGQAFFIAGRMAKVIEDSDEE